MDNASRFNELRDKYDCFEYRDFTVDKDFDRNVCHVTFHFAVPGLSEFDPEWEFPICVDEREIDDELLNRLIFNLGMVETISYYKSVCPKNVIVKCGALTKEQIKWWRKLYYNGLGEFMYRNGIAVSEDELLNISCSGNDFCKPLHDGRTYNGCLVPVGGGKDSVVSLELLKQLKNEKITTYSINGNATTKNVIDVCRHKSGDYPVKRTLDSRMLELNRQGFLNGHIPFSAVVAFSTVISAYLSGNKYIVLSNETSANETTVKDSFVNHQYSKSYEFEQDFGRYFATLTDSDIHYFSFLRPLTELQIAWLFSKCTDYHSVFRSCNAGSKQGIWCCNCPKCLFVYIILLPFLSQDELRNIFGENLLDKESLDLDFRELTGIEENKPFECVGTRREVMVCLKTFVEKGGKSLLTERYREHILKCTDNIEPMLSEWVDENSLPEDFAAVLRNQMRLHGKNILIWGYGREGKSTENFLKRQCPDAKVTIFEGVREDIEEDKYDFIVKSPGIVMKEDNPKYTSQTEIFLKKFRNQVVGITGTKGKSTTSSMLYKVLSDCSGKKVILLGNIGKPCLDYYEEVDKDTIVVFEMSCHQLMHTRVSPHVAVFLNLYEEHLDYYGTVEAYFEAKSHVTRYQTAGDYVYLGENVPYIETAARKKIISAKDICHERMHVLGEHNQYNAEFVREIATEVYGCAPEKVDESLAGFEGLPHRLQYVGEYDGVRYYDDSISTIPEAAISAADSIPDIQTILIGGMDRGINYDILVDFIKARTDLKFICAYESGRRIYDAVGESEHCFYVNDLKDAVDYAKQITDKGKACVLSPAAASYGYFKNFEERGDAFQSYIKA
jgi:UDP-N-acetylmuramoylalanine--D-glutamate ligase